jgi:hypothetical protein
MLHLYGYIVALTHVVEHNHGGQFVEQTCAEFQKIAIFNIII